MTDLTQYIPQNNDWIRECAAVMGEEALCDYYNRVFFRLYTMKHKEQLSILREVSPENYRLFIRVVCTVINELTGYGFYEYSLEENATIVLRD